MKNKVFMIMLIAVLICIAIFTGVFIGRISSRDMATLNSGPNAISETRPKNEPLNINRVSEDDLVLYLEMKSSLAREIITYRNTYGDFVYISELKNVPGMTDSIYEKIRPYLSISD